MRLLLAILLVGLLATLFTLPLALLAVGGLLIPALVFIRRAERHAPPVQE